MADYSEFPTTPTAWQEQQLRDWETVTPLSTEDPRAAVHAGGPTWGRSCPAPSSSSWRSSLMIGGEPAGRALWEGGAFLWVVLIGAGVALLMSELQQERRRRR